ncbi:YdcF family protein [Rhodoplanes sp. Z2-YC6860]|uniref:YdcF family protein n=1 Tax=Rhodoplanes sp. Z2-YC6860 TaxID=674703 RepID=UPI0018DBFE6D|nr:YdcF family protein [Rhodoplanes sp. Z2-YC6860]
MASIVSAGAFFFSVSDWLQYRDHPLAADFILPLAGDTARLSKAAELFQAGLAPFVLLSNEWHQPVSVATKVAADFEAQDSRVAFLTALGVPEPRVSTYGSNLLSTAEEAEALGMFLGKRKATILLVTSPYQARRAKIIFERELPNVRCLIVWPEKDKVQKRWWKDKESAVLVVTEIVKLIHYLSGGVFRGQQDATTAML